MEISPRVMDDPVELRDALEEAGAIPRAYAGGLDVALIGAGFGLSSRTARVTLGPGRVIVVKLDDAETIRREQLFYARHAQVLPGRVPGYLGAVIGEEMGLLVLQDVAPAEQLDVLTGCDGVTASGLVASLATLHAATWTDSEGIDPALPRWRRRAFDCDEWEVRLEAARRRFPDVLRGEAIEALRPLPGRVARALDGLAAGPQCWIHADAHLDNVLRRPDGTMVLLDWATSCMGPPLVDLAQVLAGGLVDDPSHDAWMPDLLLTYAGVLAGRGIKLDPDDLAAALSDAVLPWIQGMVGWAAAPELPSGRAGEVLRAQLAVAVRWAI